MKYLDKDGLSYFWGKTKAKINTKQDTLATQTAYTSKGSATKVPQITTNSLGQVTNISEVTITQPTVNNATLTIQKNGTAVGTFTANASSDTTANITVPTKTSDLTNDSDFVASTGTIAKANQLSAATLIGVGTGVTSTPMPYTGAQNVTIPINEIKEAYAIWGGKNISGDITPDDAGCIDEFGHNKLAFLPPECIIVEYTTDGGTTWLDYGLTNAQKIAMVTTSGPAVYIGKGTVRADQGTLTNENCSNYKARVTISTRKIGQSSGALYTRAKKWLLNLSTYGASNVKVLVEDKTIANYNNNVDTWRTVGTYTVSGWSGWNSIPYTSTFGGNATQTGQIAQIRFTLFIDSVDSRYNCAANFIDFRLIGMTNWTTPSELARAGHLYKMDTDMRAIFPNDVRPETNNSKTLGTTDYKWKNVYATTFNGNLTGNVTGNLTGTASKATGDKNGDDITTTYYLASNPSGYTSNTGTITGVSINNTSIASSGVADIKTNGTYNASTNKIATMNDIPSLSNYYYSTTGYDSTHRSLQLTRQSSAYNVPVVDNSTYKLNIANLPTATALANESTTIPTNALVYNALSNKADSSDIPTKTSDLTNDSDFVDNTSLGQQLTALSNDIYSNIPTNSQIVDLIYPVNSIYMSVNSTSPQTLFGGTWVQIKDTFLLSAGDTYTNGSTGGEATHTLTEQEMPAHTHSGIRHYQSTSSTTGYSSSWTSQKYQNDETGSKGGGQPHNNMPPYLVVYVWKRTG